MVKLFTRRIGPLFGLDDTLVTTFLAFTVTLAVDTATEVTFREAK